MSSQFQSHFESGEWKERKLLFSFNKRENLCSMKARMMIKTHKYIKEEDEGKLNYFDLGIDDVFSCVRWVEFNQTIECVICKHSHHDDKISHGWI